MWRAGITPARGAPRARRLPRPLGPLNEVARAFGGDLLTAVKQGAVREELFDALLSALGAGEELTVVVVEDPHGADEASLDLLKHVARRLTTMRVLLLLSYRDDQLTEDRKLQRLFGEHRQLSRHHADGAAAAVGADDARSGSVLRSRGQIYP